ncbi:MAG: hydroxymethylbilane synthase [Peptostreptococcus sp.]|uniref:hydroxymethylbilane synthase n=1 Tax=Peptostreptococcus sp. TaxID=1262 RepID=UPI002FC67838
MKLVAGTRGSELAITQTELVCKSLIAAFPGLEIEKKIIKTKGDKILDKALDKIGDKGIFVKEIERQLIDGKIDFAVHSLKDMPSEIDARLKLVNTPMRADARDVLIVNPKHNIDSKDAMKWLKSSNGLRVGTGSKRRIAQLLMINKSINPIPLRGNIATRISKLESEDMDAIVLAAAGIERLDIKNINVYYFDYDQMIPASGQGALAIEIKKNNTELEKIFESISDRKTELEVAAERSFLKKINGGCHIPVGSISFIENDLFVIRGIFGNEDYTNIVVKDKKLDLSSICSCSEKELKCHFIENLESDVSKSSVLKALSSLGSSLAEEIIYEFNKKEIKVNSR